MPTQAEYDITLQPNRELYSKFEILNYEFQVVGNLEGVVIGTPSYSNDSNNNVRRSCNIQIEPTDSSFDIKENGKLWMDKYIRIYIGIKSNKDNEIVYSKMGIYLINNPSQVYDATNNTISISGLDLMARMTGLRNGNLEGLEHFIPKGSNVRNVLINTIALFGFKNYIIKDYPIDTPNDISISVGGTAFDIIQEILNILPNWQVYFDVDGIFHFEEIPNGENEQVMVTDDLWKNVLINYERNYDYEKIKNHIEVLGKTIENVNGLGQSKIVARRDYGTAYEPYLYFCQVNSMPNTSNPINISFTLPSTLINTTRPMFEFATEDEPSSGGADRPYARGYLVDESGNFPTLHPNDYIVAETLVNTDSFNVIIANNKTPKKTATYDKDTNTLIIIDSDISSYYNLGNYYFRVPNNMPITNVVPNLRINSLDVLPIKNVNGLISNYVYKLDWIGSFYSTKYNKIGGLVVKTVGNYQPRAISQDDNPNSPFYVNGEIGEVNIVLSGDDYDNIDSDYLAKQRADFELYQRCKMQDSVTITCVPIYWLDTNWLVEITLPNKQGTEETNQYLIKSIDTTLGTNGTQTINLMRYYPYYPSI